MGAARPISMDAGTTPVALQARLAVKVSASGIFELSLLILALFVQAEDAVNPASTAWQPAPV